MGIRDVELIKARPNAGDIVRKRAEIHSDQGSAANYLGGGFEGYVTRVSVPIRGNMVDGLAFKRFGSEGQAAHALKTWVKLRDAGLPVPSTYRLVQEDDRYAGILMTDLTNNWQDLFITTNRTKGYVVDQVHNSSPSTIDSFRALNLQDKQSWAEVEKEIATIAEQAARNRIEFDSGDVISAVYSSDKGIHLIISDMGNVRLDSNKPYEDLLVRNRRSISTIKLMITETQRLANEVE